MMIEHLVPMARFLPSCSWPRALAKTMTWRLFATMDTFVISVLVTKNLKLAGSIVGTEAVTKMGWYLLHERAWARVAGRSRRSAEPADSDAAAPRREFGALGVRCLAVHVHSASRSSALR